MHTIARRWNSIYAIARYTIKGYIKERILLVLLIFGFILMIASSVLAPLAVGAQGKIIVDIGLALISIFGVLLVILLGASSYSREKQGGILASLLAKPISRVEFMVGKYLGTTMTIVLVMTTMSALYMFVMTISNTAVDRTILAAVYLAVLEVALIMSVMTFFSTFTSPLLSSFFTFCVFVSGHMSKDLLSFAEHFGGEAFVALSSVGFYVLPNLSMFNLRAEAVHTLPVADGYVLSMTTYAVFYIMTVLFISSIIFRRKDIL